MDLAADTIASIEFKIGKILSINQVFGGDISSAYCVNTSTNKYFLKQNSADKKNTFTAEKHGLALLESHSKMRIPKVVHIGVNLQDAFLILEWLNAQPFCKDYWNKDCNW